MPIPLSENSRRMVSWWISWEDLDWPNSDNLDRIRRRADQMLAAGVNTATVFGAHFRWDFLPIWTQLHDYLAAVSGELSQRGIALFDHHSATLVHRYDNVTGMRKVKLHSGTHLPFCPDRSSAASWTFNGCNLNSWRMYDLLTGEPSWLEQYTAEQFCFANPEFIEAYLVYVKKLLAETRISGLMCDDNIHFSGFRTCGCKVCRLQFEQRFGYPLPAFGEAAFWGNWDNPDWHAYLNLRYENNGNMLAKVRAVLPSPDFPLLSCCSGSSYGACNSTAQDIRQFMRGCNLVHLEMCGNTPAWHGDQQIHATSISTRISMAQHHRAVAGNKPQTCIAQGYGFTQVTAEIIWALSKFLAASCWFSTLKQRLGLPGRILDTLPDDASPIARAFAFEKQHPELFSGVPLTRTAVFFSYQTRNCSFFGSCENGFYQEFSDCLKTLQEHSVDASVVLEIPENTEQISVLLLPATVRMNDTERIRLKAFLANGGCVLANGPCAFLPETLGKPRLNQGDICKTLQWKIQDDEFFGSADEPWQELLPNFFWHPGRCSTLSESMHSLLAQHQHASLPVEVIRCNGYCSSLHADNAHRNYTLHLLATEFKTEIDQKLDQMRFHRSRVHLITKAAPVNTSPGITVKSDIDPVLFTPFSEDAATFQRNGNQITVHLPPECPYAVLLFQG